MPEGQRRAHRAADRAVDARRQRDRHGRRPLCPCDEAAPAVLGRMRAAREQSLDLGTHSLGNVVSLPLVVKVFDEVTL